MDKYILKTEFLKEMNAFDKDSYSASATLSFSVIVNKNPYEFQEVFYPDRRVNAFEVSSYIKHLITNDTRSVFVLEEDTEEILERQEKAILNNREWALSDTTSTHEFHVRSIKMQGIEKELNLLSYFDPTVDLKKLYERYYLIASNYSWILSLRNNPPGLEIYQKR